MITDLVENLPIILNPKCLLIRYDCFVFVNLNFFRPWLSRFESFQLKGCYQMSVAVARLGTVLVELKSSYFSVLAVNKAYMRTA